ncbi:MAG TPA: hypothetical protein VHV09_22340 [Trebonia sp.]|jgi:hypothetical protein|nr:hypothetical protein [Trebonia sp.]
MTNGDVPSRRREFRAWVRAHHPDAGGDPGEFAAGLARWRDRLRGGGAAQPEISVFRARAGLWRWQRWWRRRRRPPRVR